MEFNVGYYDFSKDTGMNFQLNRFYSMGALKYDELMEIGEQAADFQEWIALFTKKGEEAEKEENHLKAALCFRAAQFYTLNDVIDQNGYLPVYYTKPENPKGVIVLHGGYDSFIQEFLEFIFYFSEPGYEVYFFEGPGQGEVLMRCGMQMTPEWEHCTSAVLDYFHLKDVTLIGISLGGYLALRAAAFDDRIQRVVLYDLIYDFYGAVTNKMGKTKAKFFDYMTAHPRNVLWKWLDKKLNENYFMKWLLGQGYAIYENVHTPCEYFNSIKQYNTRELSKLLKQDVLVLAGESDLYTIYYEDQLKALTNARSVTGRLFTKEECADHHCQIGNLQLLLDTIMNWIEVHTDGKESSN